MIIGSALTPLRESVPALPAPAAGRRGIQPTCPWSGRKAGCLHHRAWV